MIARCTPPRRRTRPLPSGFRQAALRRPSAENGRQGFTVVEVFVAFVILLAALSAAVGMFQRVARLRRANDQRQWAVEEADNVLERLTSMPWDDLDGERMDAEPLAARARAVLPAGRMTVGVTPQDGPPAGKRIDVEIRWQSGSARAGSRVHLTAWVYRRAGHGN